MIKAIETSYNGYKFRSRLEARWAVFLDTLNIEYRYEPEGFDLEGIWYLPDFYLPHFECWLEIKPNIPSHEEREKAIGLCIAKQESVVLFAGDVWKDVKGFGFAPFYCETRQEFEPIYANYPYPLHWLSATECISQTAQDDPWGCILHRGYGWSTAHWGECPTCHIIGISAMGINPHMTETACSDDRSFLRITPRLEKAFIAARQARF